jgi:hypothetical protein
MDFRRPPGPNKRNRGEHGDGETSLYKVLSSMRGACS